MHSSGGQNPHKHASSVGSGNLPRKVWEEKAPLYAIFQDLDAFKSYFFRQRNLLHVRYFLKKASLI